MQPNSWCYKRRVRESNSDKGTGDRQLGVKKSPCTPSCLQWYCFNCPSQFTPQLLSAKTEMMKLDMGWLEILRKILLTQPPAGSAFTSILALSQESGRILQAEQWVRNQYICSLKWPIFTTSEVTEHPNAMPLAFNLPV